MALRHALEIGLTDRGAKQREGSALQARHEEHVGIGVVQVGRHLPEAKERLLVVARALQRLHLIEAEDDGQSFPREPTQGRHRVASRLLSVLLRIRAQPQLREHALGQAVAR